MGARRRGAGADGSFVPAEMDKVVMVFKGLYGWENL